MDGPFHAGEREIQRRAGVLEEADAVGRTLRSTLPDGFERFLGRQRLAVASSLDQGGRVWASLLTGPPGFLQRVDPQLLRIAAQPMAADPLADDLQSRPELGLLVLDPGTRQRARCNGRAIRNADGIFLQVEQVYGNCPKYIQRRELEAVVASATAGPSRVSSRLDASQRAAVARADTFFIASFHPAGGADASHRGGRPGFVRVVGPRRLAFADYPGNRMFNTLGNLLVYPRAGLLFLDFERGHVLQLTGRTRVGPDRAVRFDIEEAREAPGGSPLRYRLLEPSPSCPPLSQEQGGGISSSEPDRSRQ